MANERRLSTGFFALAAVTWTLLVFGSTVRVNGAGLSCPDWPLCFGKVIPQLDFRVFLEWGHRVLATTISFGFVGLGGAVLRVPSRRARFGPHLALMAVVLLCQIVLGGLTVLAGLAFWSVTLHLLFGNLFLGTMLALAVRLRGGVGSAPVQAKVRGFTLALLVAAYAQLALGGLVSSNFAGLACPDWPSCYGGTWFPEWGGLVGLQLAHRLGGYTVLGVAVGLWRASRGEATRRGSAGILALVLAQVVIGVSNVLLRIPAELAILHAATAHAILAACAIVTTQVFVRSGRGE